ncbi:MAG TPA: hypothetical protein VH092_19975, partial [Urbifossiella sp.]|nr:hypothetical protein [Urbifossiella sp.]
MPCLFYTKLNRVDPGVWGKVPGLVRDPEVSTLVLDSTSSGPTRRRPGRARGRGPGPGPESRRMGAKAHGNVTGKG